MAEAMVTMIIQEGELAQIMAELNAAQEKIYDCYNRLQRLGYLRIEEATSGN